MERFNEKCQRRNTGSVKWDGQKNKDALPFWVADSDYRTCDEVVTSLKQRVEAGHFGYHLYTEKHYQVVKNWYKDRYQTDILEEWIIFIPSIVASIKLAVEAYTNENDGVLIQTPVYFQFQRLIKASKRKIIDNKLLHIDGKYSIDWKDLDEKLALAKIMILCSPHNPVGRVWKADELKQISELCLKHNVILISDEVHGDFIMPGENFLSMLKIDSKEHDLLMVSSSPSKTFNLAGLKAAFMIIPSKKLRDEYCQKLSDSFLPSINALGLTALESAYTNGAAWVDAQNKHIYANFQLFKETLNKEFPNFEIAPLEGTYLAWLDLSSLNLSHEQLMEKLIENGITLNDGYNFSEDFDGFIRFNLACSLEQLQAGLKILVKTIKSII